MNHNSILKKLEELNNGGKTKYEANPLMWKPSPGENTIRIITLVDQTDLPFKELKFHYGKNPNGRQGLMSPSSYGEPDPFIMKSEILKRQGNALTFDKQNPQPEKGKPIYFLGKDLEPIKRFHCLIIDRNAKTVSLQWWQHGEKIFESILKDIFKLQKDLEELELVEPGQEVNVFHAVKGHDLVVTYLPPKSKEKYVLKENPDYTGEFSDNQYGETTVSFKKKSTVITEDIELGNKIMHEQPDLFELYPKTSYEELEKILNQYLASRENETYTPTETKKVETKEEKETETVSQAKENFNDLFKD